jgi:ABC-type uncharacterized transport system involved in gliding motility auxiliary subunit
MKHKKLETLLYSAVGIVAMALILVAVNYIAATFRSRVDLTADKLYTLSEGTKKIVGKLDTKVKIRLYYSQRDNAMPVFLKTYAQRVEDLPAPFGPRKPCTSPARTSRSSPSRAVKRPYRLTSPEARTTSSSPG